jgi:hypothetical protein
MQASAAFVVLVCLAESALADSGLPMICIYWPTAWLALIPVVAIEALLGMWMLKIRLWRAVLISGIANIISTLVGIPLTWLVVATIEGIWFGHAAGLQTFWQQVYSVTVQAPWLVPYEEDMYWMVPVAGAVLTAVFYVASVATEYAVAIMFFPRQQWRRVFAWVWRANLLSYTLLAILVAIKAINILPRFVYPPIIYVTDQMVLLEFWLCHTFIH